MVGELSEGLIVANQGADGLHAVGAHKMAGVLAVVNVSHFAVRTVRLGALGVVAFAAGLAADLALVGQASGVEGSHCQELALHLYNFFVDFLN